MQAFDGSAATKWLDFGAAGGGSAWLEYRLPPSTAPAAVLRYSLTSADDAPERDPRDWALEGLPADEQAGSAGAGVLPTRVHDKGLSSTGGWCFHLCCEHSCQVGFGSIPEVASLGMKINAVIPCRGLG